MAKTRKWQVTDHHGRKVDVSHTGEIVSFTFVGFDMYNYIGFRYYLYDLPVISFTKWQNVKIVAEHMIILNAMVKRFGESKITVGRYVQR